MAGAITLADTVGLPAPIFLRKLRRKADWGSIEIPVEERAVSAVRSIFLNDSMPYSVFRVTTDDEFTRVVLGLNSGRTRLDGDSDFIAVLPRELGSLGIAVEKTPGRTSCRLANSLHFDMSPTEDQLRELCHQMLAQGRAVIHLKKNMIRPLVDQARSEGCLVIKESTNCSVIGCP